MYTVGAIIAIIAIILLILSLLKEKKVEIFKPKDFEFTVMALPSFPSFKVSQEARWRYINKNTTLQKICGDLKPTSQIGILFNIKSKLDAKMDSECYPTSSPLTFYVEIINKES